MRIVFAVAALVMLVGLVIGLRTYVRISHSLVCWGTVDGLPESSDSDGTTYGVAAHFTAQDGRAYHYLSSWKASSPGYAIGEGIRIYSDPADPTRNGIMSFMGAYGVASILVVIGSGVGIVMLLAMNSYRVMECIHPDRFPATPTVEQARRF